VKVARNELAIALARDLLARGLTGEQFVNLVEDSGETARFIEAVGEGVRRNDSPELRELSAELRALYEGGRLDIARNPQQIAENIENLTGNLRARRLAPDSMGRLPDGSLPGVLVNVLPQGTSFDPPAAATFSEIAPASRLNSSGGSATSICWRPSINRSRTRYWSKPVLKWALPSAWGLFIDQG